MILNRKQLIAELESVAPGLSTREYIEQSTCFIFKDKKVYTYNDEITCSHPCCLDMPCVVPAEKLFSLLKDKLRIEEIDITKEDGNLVIRGKGGRVVQIPIESKIRLPIDSIQQPKNWVRLPKEFDTAVQRLENCVGKDEARFHLTCIHIHPEWIESTNNQIIGRYKVKSGLKKSVLVRQKALDAIKEFNVTHFGLTKTWLHFKNADGLLFSCRTYIEKYPELSEFLEIQGEEVVLPKEMAQVINEAVLFADTSAESDPHILIDLCPGKLVIKSQCIGGSYLKPHKVKYDGKPMRFIIDAGTLRRIIEEEYHCVLGKKSLKASKDKCTYAVFLTIPKIQGTE